MVSGFPPPPKAPARLAEAPFGREGGSWTFKVRLKADATYYFYFCQLTTTLIGVARLTVALITKRRPSGATSYDGG